MRNSSRAQLVLFYVQRVEDALEEVSEQQLLLKEKKDVVTSELKAARESGLNPKVIKQMIAERNMESGERREFLTECELYRAACGDLDGRSLSTHARRATFPPPTSSESRTEDEMQAELPAVPEVPQPPPAEQVTAEMIEAARAEGASAAEAGQPVTSNPYEDPDDQRRASWDCGWCQHAGSDGMDIPKALQPKKKGGQTEPSNDDDEAKKAA